MSDGTIIIDTSVNSSGAEKGIQGLSGKLGSMASGALGATAKVTAAMLAVATGAVVALTKSSIEQYAQYEQLTGGVDTLFKKSSDRVMKYADGAYKTAGMSANEYMSTVTGFSASLLQGLGGDTKKAADIGNMAVTDMADNANKMGTGIGNIQTAYQGFAKQNYTMLDNLKLGYGGTKTEMQRLLVDATKLTGVKYNLSNFSDVITAIHAIQSATGITGTTAKEAASTIEGSLNMTKSAWANLLVGMADEESDFDGLINNLVTSVGAFGENILPRIEVVIEGIGLLIAKLLPQIIDKIPGLINKILPGLLSAGASIVSSLGSGILASLPVIISSGLQVIQSLITGLQSNIPAIMSAIVQIMTSLVTGILTLLPQLLSVGLQIIGNLAMGIGLALPTLIPLAMQCVMSLVNAIITNLPLLLNAGLQIITGLVTGILTALPQLIAMLPTLIKSIVTFITTSLPIIIQTGVTLLVALINGLVKALPQLIAMLPQIINSITKVISTNLPVIIQAAITIMLALINGLVNALPQLIAMLPQIIDSILKVITTNLPIILQAAITIMLAIIKGLVQALPQLIAMLPTIINTIVKVLTDNLPLIINAAIQIIIAIQAGLIQALPGLIVAAIKIAGDLMKAFNDVDWLKIGIDILAGIGKGIIAGIGTVIQAAKDAASRIKNAFTDFFDINSPSRVMRDEVGVMIGKGMAAGIKASTPEVVTSATKMAQGVLDAAKKFIDDKKYYNKISLEDELYVWQTIQKKYKAGNVARIEADKEVYRLKGELVAKSKADNEAKIAKEETDRADSLSKTKAELDDRKYYNKLTLQEEYDAWVVIQNKYKVGTNQRIEADKEVYRLKNELIAKEKADAQELVDLNKSYSDKILSLEQTTTDKRKSMIDDYYAKTKEINDKQIADVTALNKTYDDAVTSRANSLYTSTGLFDAVTVPTEEVTGASLIKNLQDQATEFATWKSSMAGLSQKGISEDLVKELTDMGPKSVQQIKALNNLTASELDTYVSLWQSKHDEAKTQAVSELESLRLETATKVAQINTDTAASLTAYNNMFVMQMVTLNADAANQLTALNAEWALKVDALKATTTAQVTTMATDITTTVTTLRTDTETEFTTLATNIQTIMAAPNWNSVGANIIKGIQAGVTSRANALAQEVARVALMALMAAKAALGIHSPSTVFRDQVGAMMAQGIGVGFEDETKNVQKSMQGNLSDLVAKMQDTVGYETASITAKVVASNGYKSGQQGTTTTNDNGVTQHITIVKPVSTPSENARAIKKVGRDLVNGYI